MNTACEVYLWNTKVGTIMQKECSLYTSFEYDKSFLKSGIELSPIKLPLSNKLYKFPELAEKPFFGLPGLFSDSLPDNFGNQVIEKWLETQGKSLNDFNAIDRLCYTGKRGMGALEYLPSTLDNIDLDQEINVKEMVKFVSEILANREQIVLEENSKFTYQQLLQVGSSAGGARAKALIALNDKTNEIRSGQINLAKDFDYWLMKFDNVNNNGDHGLVDNPQYTVIEYIYYQMALDCKITMNECRLYNSEGMNHFMTKRFDRVDGNKLHMQSLGAISHTSYQQPGSCSYELATYYMKMLDLYPSEIEEFYRRMVFNVLAVNQDDHVKNISFLMDKTGKWSLAPFYDVTFSYNPENKWLKAHQMTINGKTTNINHSDLLVAGLKMGIKTDKCENIIQEISKVVLKFSEYAEKNKLNTKMTNYIQKIIEKQNKLLTL